MLSLTNKEQHCNEEQTNKSGVDIARWRCSASASLLAYISISECISCPCIAASPYCGDEEENWLQNIQQTM